MADFRVFVALTAGRISVARWTRFLEGLRTSVLTGYTPVGCFRVRAPRADAVFGAVTRFSAVGAFLAGDFFLVTGLVAPLRLSPSARICYLVR